MSSGNFAHTIPIDKTEEVLKLDQAIKLQELGHQEMMDGRYEPALQFFIIASEKLASLKKTSKNQEITTIARNKLAAVLAEVILLLISRQKTARGSRFLLER